jgi:hypothetical protein
MATEGGRADLRRALRDGLWEQAVTLAEASLARPGEGADETLYLQALALHHLGRDEASIAAARRLVSGHPASPWLRKARFLESRGLVRLGRFEQAEAIYEEEAHRLLSADRKRQIASVLIEFARELSTEPDPSDPGALPASPRRTTCTCGSWTFRSRASCATT